MSQLYLKFGLCALLLSGGCRYVSFARNPTSDEIALKAEIETYYTQAAQAFAVGNAGALAELYSPSITHPMTLAQIREWADKFFAEHKTAHLKFDKIEIEQLSHVQAVVLVHYSVETPTGQGNFGGVERDTLVQLKSHWYISAWDKLP